VEHAVRLGQAPLRERRADIDRRRRKARHHLLTVLPEKRSVMPRVRQQQDEAVDRAVVTELDREPAQQGLDVPRAGLRLDGRHPARKPERDVPRSLISRDRQRPFDLPGCRARDDGSQPLDESQVGRIPDRLAAGIAANAQLRRETWFDTADPRSGDSGRGADASLRQPVLESRVPQLRTETEERLRAALPRGRRSSYLYLGTHARHADWARMHSTCVKRTRTTKPGPR